MVEKQIPMMVATKENGEMNAGNPLRERIGNR